jgi:hypothetical protein
LALVVQCLLPTQQMEATEITLFLVLLLPQVVAVVAPMALVVLEQLVVLVAVKDVTADLKLVQQVLLTKATKVATQQVLKVLAVVVQVQLVAMVQAESQETVALV